MNITTDSAGSVSQKHILSKGFQIFKIIEGNDMGQGTYEIPQYERADGLKIVGGYWSYNIEDKNGNVLFQGWWNSDEEFDETITHVDYLMKYQPHQSKYEQLKSEYDKLLLDLKEHCASDLSLNGALLRIKYGIQTELDGRLLSEYYAPIFTKIETEYGTISIINHESFNKR